MIAEGLFLPVNATAQGNALSIHDQEIWMVRKHDNPSVTLRVVKDAESYDSEIEYDSLLLFDRVHLTVLSGRIVYRKIRIDILSKLLAFVDEAGGISDFHGGEHLFFTTIELQDSQVLTQKPLCESWFLAAYMTKQTWMNRLCGLLRRTECYALVRYLLSHSINQPSLYDLGKAYGVSYSHFRRLCSHALGGKVKAELCSWRMARAVLEVIEGKADMTSIAYKYGYSSSSHFSAEVKSRLGKTPRELSRKS